MKILKKVGAFLLLVATCVGCTALLSRCTNGFNDKPNPLNDDNLVHKIEEYGFEEGNFSNGLKIKINDNGSVYINGTYAETETQNEVLYLGSVIVEKEDFYTLTGAPKGSTGTYYIVATYTDGSGRTQNLYSDKTDTMTSPAALTVGTEVSISIVIVPGAKLNMVTLKPTFVPGKEAGKF